MESCNLANTTLSAYIDLYRDPRTSTDSRTIQWGKNGAKFDRVGIRHGVESGKTNGETTGGAHFGG